MKAVGNNSVDSAWDSVRTVVGFNNLALYSTSHFGEQKVVKLELQMIVTPLQYNEISYDPVVTSQPHTQKFMFYLLNRVSMVCK